MNVKTNNINKNHITTTTTTTTTNNNNNNNAQSIQTQNSF